MNYKFEKIDLNYGVDPSSKFKYEFGVNYDSLKEPELSLYNIVWNGWTPKNIQELIDKTLSLEGEEYFDFIVEGTELRICIDTEYVLFFDWRTENIEDDFRWTTDKFIVFMTAFKEFVSKNS